MKKITLLLLTFLILVSCSETATNEKDVEEKSNEGLEIEVTDENNQADEDANNSTANPEGKLTVHYIDVGQGDATLLQAVEGEETFNLLIDAGDWTGDEVVPYLKSQSVESLDVVIGTHIHADHIGQLDEVIQKFPVDEVWMTGNVHTTSAFEDVLTAIEQSEASYVEPRSGEEFEIGPFLVEVYHPTELSGDFNDDSISTRVTYGDVRFLFTGDAEAGAEEEMLANGFDLDADIFQLGHHGSSTSNTPAFVQAVDPEVAIYSAGLDNDYGHPHYETVELMNKMGIDLYGTEAHGTIVVESNGERFSVQPEREATIKKEKPDFLKNNDDHESAKSHESCIDINSASLKDLYDIIHIDEARAAELVELRPHHSLNGLKRIYGIGDGRLADIKEEGLACVKE
ncbi:MBL fold metallo-hydrolase [Allobacillus sp. GCM10007491]|uniref:MBL fold metallo-hydrolase n=1 Tax=Allobacillus saliphilus TaxID=2912308 RepID=A0A941CWH3_9BACI|nr:MBL fold metallo-hydrolase [Allobacillus saliphilus]MBR7554744.1 MBL fold metallo-hydrolase [Allobacillus saliphilus]MBR7554929.1 MBL fold metallo-hydrolase [Allobacillus saliphilus]